MACGRVLLISIAILLLSSVSCEEAPIPRFDIGGSDNQCATTCHEVNCDAMGIRYGKYCGVGHGGCPGEKPCDSVDRCCMKHDSCVEKKGVLDNSCHSKFISCINKYESATGFSKTCPYSLVIPTMRSGIQMAMAFAGAFSGMGAGAAPPAAVGQQRDALDL